MGFVDEPISWVGLLCEIFGGVRRTDLLRFVCHGLETAESICVFFRKNYSVYGAAEFRWCYAENFAGV
jgi:hypothetical protein